MSCVCVCVLPELSTHTRLNVKCRLLCTLSVTVAPAESRNAHRTESSRSDVSSLLEC